MSTILGANSVSGSYEIDNSLRFADNAKLTKTLDSAGNRKTYTLSTWIKRSHLDEPFVPFYNYSSDSAFFAFLIHHSSDKLLLYQAEGGTDYGYQTDIVFRDPSAWYHIVLAVDTTQSTAANRVILYVNGSEVTFDQNYGEFPENHDTRVNSTVEHTIGTYQDISRFADQYMTEFHFIEGSAKAPTDFGKTDDNGVWVPIKYTGTYGTNGYYLEFKETGTSQNSSGIGADTSGNDNHWAVTNLAATDITTDTPTNNFATWNAAVRTTAVLSEGNTQIAAGAPGYYPGSYASIVPTNGKWYAEFKVTVATYGQLGIITASTLIDGARNVFSTTSNIYWQDNNTVIALYLTDGDGTATDSGNAAVSGGSNSVPEYGTDVISIALDMDNGKGYFAKNGTFVNSSNPANGTNSFTLASDYADGSTFYFGGNNFTVQANFGNPPYAPDSGNADANGHGNFEYAVPSGYFAICTKNLAEFG